LPEQNASDIEQLLDADGANQQVCDRRGHTSSSEWAHED